MSEKPLYEDKVEGYTIRFFVEDIWVRIEVVDKNGDIVIAGIHRIAKGNPEQLLEDPDVRMAFARAALVALSFFKKFHRYTGWTGMYARRVHDDLYDVRIW